MLGVLALVTLLAILDRRSTKAPRTWLDTWDVVALLLLSVAFCWTQCGLLPTL